MLSCTDVKRRQMEQVIIEADSMNRNYVPMTSDSLLTIACDFYDRHGTPNERMKAHYLLGCAYRDMGEAPHALDEYHAASDCADTTAQDCDYRTLATVYGQMGELFYWQDLIQNALWAYDMGCHNAMKSRDTLLSIVFYEQKAKCYYDMGMPDSMEIVNRETHKLYLQYGDTLSANTTVESLFYLAIERKNFSKAAGYIDIFEHHSLIAKDTLHYQESWGTFKIHKGLYYLGVHKPDSAVFYFHGGLGLTHNPYNHLMAYEGLYETYKELDIKDSIVKYAEMSIRTNDSTVNTHIADQMQRVQALYNYNRFRMKSDRLSMEADKAQQKIAILSLILMVFASITIVIFTALAIYFLRKRVRKQQLKVRYAADSLLISYFNDELNRSSKQPEQEQAITEKIQFLKESLSRQAKGLDVEIFTESFQESDIVEMIREYGQEGRLLPDVGWKNLRQAINVYVPSFMDSLAELNANLDLSETQVCQLALIRNMPQKAKAAVMGLEYHAAAMKRKRLFKTLFDKEGSAKDLEEYLQRIAFGIS